MKPNELIAKIENGELDKNFKKIYVSDSAVEEQKPRYIRTIKEFINLFGDDRDVFVLSAPGRTEVCGNHTDHNNGKVLAASINLDAIAIAAKRDDMKSMKRVRATALMRSTFQLFRLMKPNTADHHL